MKTIEQILNTPSEREQALRATNGRLEKELKAAYKRLGQRQEFADAIAGAVHTLKPLAEFPKTAAGKAGTLPAVTMGIQWSDWHIGQTAGYDHSKYNWMIAQQRMAYLTDSMIRWAKGKRHMYDLRKCHVLSLSDFVSGIIHEELITEAEFPLPVQIARAAQLHAEHLRRLAGEFETVEVDAIDADNHGRLSRKPRSQDKARNNVSWLVHEMSQQATAGIKNIQWVRTAETRMVVKVAKTKFLIEHGDTIRGSQYGTPWYALLRMAMRRAKHAMAGRGEHFDVFAIGHFHTSKFDDADGLMVNGALTGTIEYDEDNARSAGPTQNAFMVSPSHGIFDFTPFRADGKAVATTAGEGVG